MVLSEYGIEPVSKPIHLNRELRKAGLLTVRDEMGHELLDAGDSAAFAVADHQIAHVYVNDQSRLDEVRDLLRRSPGVERVLDAATKVNAHLDHSRSGELVAIAEPGAWFTYYYWLDEARRPDFARTVDIHRKPGYDPVELFIDPELTAPQVRAAFMLLKRKMGFRTLMELIPTNASLVKGSHGRPPASSREGPLFMTSAPELLPGLAVEADMVFDLLLRHLTA